MSLRILCNHFKAVSHQLLIRRNAGHSKWANIKHTKAKTDALRSRFMNLLYIRMRVALQSGGYDPETNLQLRQLFEEAQANNIAKTSVSGMLEKLKNAKNNGREHIVELCGPAFSYYLLTFLTNNIAREMGTLRSVVRKSCLSTGKALHAFEQAAYVVTRLPDSMHVDAAAADEPPVPDQALGDAIEVGAEEVCVREWGGRPALVFSTDWHQVQTVRGALVERHYEICSAETVYEPREMVQLPAEQLQDVAAAVEKMRAFDAFIGFTSNVVDLE